MAKRTALVHQRSAWVTNLVTGEYRYETFESRPHLVVPVVLATEGVHHGSSGPLLYTAQELATMAEAWNGVPVPVFHPENNGAPCTCNDPRIIERQNVGRMFNVRFEDNKLKGEAWIDIQKAEQVHSGLIELLTSSNHNMEVSTGLLSQHEPVSGTWNGEDYEAIVRNIRPDHLALLPGSRGACSWADGCGVRANMAHEQTINKDDKYIVNLMGQREAHSKLFAFVDSMDTETMINYLEEVYDSTFVFKRVTRNAAGSRQVEYFKVPYSFSDNGDLSVQMDDATQVQKQVSYEAISQNSQTDEGDQDMAKRKDAQNTENQCPECTAVIDGLIANEHSHFQEQDRNFLEEMDLDTLKKFEPIVPDTNEETPAEPTVPDTNEEEEEPMTEEQYIANAPGKVGETLKAAMAALDEQKGEAIAAIKANANNEFTDEQLQAKDLPELKMLAKLSGNTNYSGQGGTIDDPAQRDENADGGEPLSIPTLTYDK